MPRKDKYDISIVLSPLSTIEVFYYATKKCRKYCVPPHITYVCKMLKAANMDYDAMKFISRAITNGCRFVSHKAAGEFVQNLK